MSLFRRGNPAADTERLAAAVHQHWLGELRTDPPGGATVPLSALRGEPRYARPPIMLAGQQAPWVMTVNPPAPGVPGPTPQGVRAAVYIETEVGVLEDDGKLYDEDASNAIAVKAARRLRGSRQPWEPGEEHRREIARIFGGDAA